MIFVWLLFWHTRLSDIFHGRIFLREHGITFFGEMAHLSSVRTIDWITSTQRLDFVRYNFHLTSNESSESQFRKELKCLHKQNPKHLMNINVALNQIHHVKPQTLTIFTNLFFFYIFKWVFPVNFFFPLFIY